MTERKYLAADPSATIGELMSAPNKEWTTELPPASGIYVARVASEGVASGWFTVKYCDETKTLQHGQYFGGDAVKLEFLLQYSA